jgi:hypothetical protein
MQDGMFKRHLCLSLPTPSSVQKHLTTDNLSVLQPLTVETPLPINEDVRGGWNHVAFLWSQP